MMLAHHDLRVVHVSTHVSLREACDRVKKARVLEVIEIAHQACKDMGIENPKVAVAGLNPHCGENGLFGTEEIEEIKPAIEAAKAEGRELQAWKAVEGVNVTLGLPIIRTSVDHGTGFALAGKGTSNELSLVNAIDYAVRMAKGRN